MIRRNVALEARLIDDLLDLTAISAGKVSLQPDARRHARAGRRRWSTCWTTQVEDKRLRLELRAGAPRTPLVQADEARMQQVLWNLLRNAIKFTPDGGRIELRTAAGGRPFVLDCTDSGIGIDAGGAAAHLQRLRAGRPRRSRSASAAWAWAWPSRAAWWPSTGARSRAHSDGPRPAAPPSRCTLPAARPSAGGRPTGAAPRRRRRSGGGWRLLLVEDNDDAAETIVMCLESYGYEVTHVATCAEALRTARAAGRSTSC